jgi:hypothetical protein
VFLRNAAFARYRVDVARWPLTSVADRVLAQRRRDGSRLKC